MSRAKDEFKIQADFVRYVELMYPDLLYTISPAGFIMSAGMAMKMVRMGYRKGTPDILFFEPRGAYHGFLMEIKTQDGKTSEAQETFLGLAREREYAIAICRSVDEAISALRRYLAVR